MKTFLPVALITLGCFLATPINSFAQMNDGARFGIKLGVNGANLYDDIRAEDKKARIGYTAGVFGQFPLGKGRFSLRPELLFSAKGAAFDFQNGTRPEVKLSYVELPISLQWQLFGFLNLHGGMYASLLADANGKLTDANGNPVSFNFDKSDYSNVDYGWHLGGGLDIGNIGLHLRVSRGLKEVAEENSLQDYLGNLKNATWALTASWAF
ncbi:MAG: PorT family protein [Saprospiraceae bacterium]|nr:PorT family protein [Saprospiraceae bacterium]